MKIRNSKWSKAVSIITSIAMVMMFIVTSSPLALAASGDPTKVFVHMKFTSGSEAYVNEVIVTAKTLDVATLTHYQGGKFDGEFLVDLGQDSKKDVVSSVVIKWNGGFETDAVITQSSMGGGTINVKTNGAYTYPGTINNAPVAVNDSYSINKDTVLNVTAPGILANDTDADGDTLTVASVSNGPGHGTLNWNADGSISYTPNPGYVGTDSFKYKANDGETNSAKATVTITIEDPNANHAPVAVDDSYSTYKNTELNVDDPGVLANDTDADGGTLTAVLVSGPAHASSFTLNADGSFDYTPAAGFVGIDTFTYKANDTMADSNVATVTITILNHAPVAGNDSYSVDEDKTLTVAVADGILKNDSDPDGDSLTITKLTDPSRGTLNLNTADGSFTYTPEAGYPGVYTFTYKVSDGIAEATATVTITVNPVEVNNNHAPLAANDAYSVNEDNVLTVAAPGILSNDSDADSDALTIELVSGTAHGTLVLNADGSFTYTPDANYNGTDSFVYKAYDGKAYSNEATVTITINPVSDNHHHDNNDNNDDTTVTIPDDENALAPVEEEPTVTTPEPTVNIPDEEGPLAPAEEDENIPQTGAESGLGMLGLLLSSGFGIALLSRKRK